MLGTYWEQKEHEKNPTNTPLPQPPPLPKRFLNKKVLLKVLLTYIVGPKEEALHFSIESFILGSLHSFNFFFCDQRKKLDL